MQYERIELRAICFKLEFLFAEEVPSGSDFSIDATQYE